MKKIICRTTAKAEQSFYLEMDGQTFFLFSQDYRKSVKEYFYYGVNINDALDLSKSNGEATYRTKRKLMQAINSLEREEGVLVLRKSDDLLSTNSYKGTKKVRLQKMYEEERAMWVKQYA